MTTETQLITAETFLQMPATGDRRELILGEVKEMSPSGQEHGRVTIKFTWPLAQFVDANDLGTVYAAETGFLLSKNPDTVRGADIAFVSKQRLEKIGSGSGYWPGAPDLVVEVISPSDRYTEVDEKVLEWIEAGARLVVVINPRNRTLKVYTNNKQVSILTETDEFDAGEIVPGFKLLVSKIFS